MRKTQSSPLPPRQAIANPDEVSQAIDHVKGIQVIPGLIAGGQAAIRRRMAALPDRTLVGILVSDDEIAAEMAAHVIVRRHQRLFRDEEKVPPPAFALIPRNRLFVWALAHTDPAVEHASIMESNRRITMRKQMSRAPTIPMDLSRSDAYARTPYAP